MDRTPEEILAGMSVTQKAAQVIMPAFTRWTETAADGLPSAPLREDVREILEKYGFAGVILFAPDVMDTARAVRLVNAMQQAGAAGGHPGLLTMIDQEGGETVRLGRGTQLPGNMALGAADDPALTEKAGRLTGEELRLMGLNCDAAPVLDVNSNPANPIIGVRSFSDDPETAARHGIRFMKGLQAAGVIPVVKHFPGHGDTDTDSHVGLPLVDKPLEALRAFELVPFRACLEAGAEMLMTAHIQYPQVERRTHVSRSTGEAVFLPATLSPTILTDLLRGELGFRGVVISDAMNMQAVARHFTPMETARLALCAGVDILLMPVDTAGAAGAAALEPYIRGIAAMAEAGEIPMAALDTAALRVLRLKEHHGLLAGAPAPADPGEAAAGVGSGAHLAAAWDMACRALTVLRDRDTLPLRPGAEEKVLILAPDAGLGQAAAWGAERAGRAAEVLCLPDATAEELAEAVWKARYVIGLSALFGPSEAEDGRLRRALRLTREAGGRFVLVSCQLPYDAARYPEADAVVLAWCARMAPGAMARPPYQPNTAAAVFCLLTGSPMTGKPPLRIPGTGAEGRL